jgi:hypothetical protein
MKTKQVIEDRLKKVASKDTIYFNIPEYVYMVHKFPYKRLHSKNALYHYLCQFLQRGTNMIALIAGDDVQPATIDVLRKMSGMAIKTFETYFTMLVSDGIIMMVRSGKLNRYYMNPFFAIAGDNLSQFFIDMWKVSGDKVIGEHMFADDNELYHDNRNKDQRFGYLRDRQPYKEHGKYKKRKK